MNIFKRLDSSHTVFRKNPSVRGRKFPKTPQWSL
ncbi:Uncharacterised protein [uncultured archaeon]|nr:Uncharacterised protein [uncultured archaeon]